MLKGGHEALIRLIENTTNVNVIRQGTWALANLCRGTPLPKFDIIKPIIPILCKTVANNILSGEEQIDALWALANNS